MTKSILTKDEMQSPMMTGMNLIADIVKRTLGPGGLPVIIERKGESLEGSPLGPRITKDGVSVAEECFDADPATNVAIQAIKAICKKTNQDAGDGTTTAICLGQALMKSMLDVVEDSKVNPQTVKESLEAATKDAIARLKAKATPVDLAMLGEVATISANGDSEIGSIIQQAFEHVGSEGIITVEEGVGTDVTVNLVDGYQFSRGAEARDGFFNNETRTHYVAEKITEEDSYVGVLIYDGKLQNFVDIIPALEKIAGMDANGRATRKFPPTVIVANEFSREFLTWLLIQKADAGFSFCAVKGPNTTDVRSGYYDDLAVYTGGTRLGNGGRALSAFEFEDLGYVEKAVITGRTTTLYGGQGAEEDILVRVKHLQARKAAAESPYDVQIIGERLAALTNGVAKIGVGGFTELEIKEKYDRIEDALNACRAAIQEGVVDGGGKVLLEIANDILMTTLDDKQDLSNGETILTNALREPFFLILRNVGFTGDEVAKLTVEVLDSKIPNAVYDSKNKVIVDAKAKGILDPVKVTRCALENAVSIAGLLCTAGGAIVYTKPTTVNG